MFRNGLFYAAWAYVVFSAKTTFASSCVTKSFLPQLPQKRAPEVTRALQKGQTLFVVIGGCSIASSTFQLVLFIGAQFHIKKRFFVFPHD